MVSDVVVVVVVLGWDVMTLSAVCKGWVLHSGECSVGY